MMLHLIDIKRIRIIQKPISCMNTETFSDDTVSRNAFFYALNVTSAVNMDVLVIKLIQEDYVHHLASINIRFIPEPSGLSKNRVIVIPWLKEQYFYT